VHTYLLKLSSPNGNYDDVAYENCRLHEYNKKAKAANENHDKQ
jgi:hypothetical protein